MELIVILILILVNGLFSMSEISITSARKSKLDVESKKGSKSAKRVIKVIGNPDNFLSTVQIAITAVGLITGIYSGESLIGPLGQFICSLGIDLSLSNVLARIIIVIAITYVTLVLGELFPKKIGLNTPERIAKIIVGPMNFLTRLFYPFVWLLTISTNTLMAIFGIKKKTFDKMLEILNNSYIELHSKGGKNPKLSVLDKLIIMLDYYREYRSMENIAFDYGVVKSTICDSIKWVENTLITDSVWASGFSTVCPIIGGSMALYPSRGPGKYESAAYATIAITANRAPRISIWMFRQAVTPLGLASAAALSAFAFSVDAKVNTSVTMY